MAFYYYWSCMTKLHGGAPVYYSLTASPRDPAEHSDLTEYSALLTLQLSDSRDDFNKIDKHRFGKLFFY